MKEDLNSLEEVQVVAFSKQKKSSVIGSVSTINTSDLKLPSTNLTSSFAGQIAGMISYQRSGEPGQDNAEFFIRGVTTFGYKNDPLILLDGLQITTSDLARIDHDNVASFSIMKDATATSLYGARGANGKPNKQVRRFGKTAQRQEIHPPLGQQHKRIWASCHR